MVVLSYPLQLDPSRRCLTSLVYAVIGKREKKRQEQQHQDNGEVGSEGESMFESLAETTFSSNGATDPAAIEHDEEMRQLLDSFLFYGITCIFLVLSFSIAMVVSDLGIILGIVGATGSTMVSYILPGKYYVATHQGFIVFLCELLRNNYLLHIDYRCYIHQVAP